MKKCLQARDRARAVRLRERAIDHHLDVKAWENGGKQAAAYDKIVRKLRAK